MNEQEVKLFLDELFEKVLPQGDLTRISEFYTEDVIGHQNNQEYNLEDIKQRFKLFRKNFTACTFKISNFLMQNNLIFVSVYQQWLEKQDNELYEAILPIVYRLRDNKICEIWSLVDSSLGSYQMQNANLKLSWKLFNVTDKTKKNFISKLMLSEYFTQPSSPRCSEIEKECLYYYLHGFTAKETARVLGISPRTIETHIVNIKNKLNCHTKSELRQKFFSISLNKNSSKGSSCLN